MIDNFIRQQFQLTPEQQRSHASGVSARQSLIETADETAERCNIECSISGNFKLHTLITGSTGVGKTHWIEQQLKKSNTHYIKIRGGITLPAFGQKLLMEHYTFMKMPNRSEKMVILLDDVNMFFENLNTIGILLAMTDETNPVFEWNKIVLDYQWKPGPLEIMRTHYANPNGAPGYTIPCDNFVFVVTTNFKFPTDNKVERFNSADGGSPRGAKLAALAAVRRRFTTREFWLPKSTYWGWLYEVAANDNLVKHPDFVKHPYRYVIIHNVMSYLWNNWDNLREHNLTTVKEMIIVAIKHPDSYVNKWDAFLQPEWV